MGKLINNQAGNKFSDELKSLIQPGAKLSLIVDHFSVYAFVFLSDKLKDVESLKVLWTNQQETNIKKIFGNDDERIFKNQFLLRFAAESCVNFFESKAEFKKGMPFMKILINDGLKKFSASMNSTDFNCGTLGLVTSSENTIIELKTEENEIPLIDAYQQIFNQQWSVSGEDIKTQLLKELERAYKDYSPEFIYQFTLSRIFEGYEELAEEQNELHKIGLEDTLLWKELKPFQKDGVIGAINKIKKYNGCILADSVGLGKTYQALTVIKYFQLRNSGRVLVLCPKKLRENWSIYKENDTRNYFSQDRIFYDLLSHTDLSRTEGMVGDTDLSNINWGNYDLVVIDESHNFRNNNKRYKKLIDQIISKGLRTKVLLLSATPVNNKMNDLKHQIYMITENKDDAFVSEGIDSIQNLMKGVQREFNNWIKGDRNPEILLDNLSTKTPAYFDLLDKISIARCRKHIKGYYEEEIHFPQRKQTINYPESGDDFNQQINIEDIVNEINTLNLRLYAPITRLLNTTEVIDKYAKKYDNEVSQGVTFRQTDREESLIYLMRVNLLKRLESSSTSFGLTLNSIINKIDDILVKIEKTEDYLEDENIIPEEFEELREELSVGKKIRIELQDMDLIRWKPELEEDKNILKEIIAKVQLVGSSKDAKLAKLKDVIRKKIEIPINANNKKILIFTAFADTANYIYDELVEWAYNEFGIYTALVSGSQKDKTNLPIARNANGRLYRVDFNYILTNFSPIAKKRENTYPNCTNQIDLLIATDCVSEGQNLQDCDFLINYDIHWNPVRIIQRFGRIDRMGSINNFIQLVNFWPMDDLNEYINLRGRVEGRAVMVDIAASGGENVIAEVEMEDETREETNDYRIRQLQELKENKDIELDDLAGGISISDFTFNDYKSDLYRFLKDNHEDTIKTPEGIHAVVPIPENESHIAEGVVFCIKERNTGKFLLVVTDKQGTILMNYNQRKKILELCKKLCRGNGKIYPKLIQTIEKETKQFTDMQHFKSLYSAAVDAIIGKTAEEGERSLYKTGGTLPQNSSITANDNYELVSFFILKRG